MDADLDPCVQIVIHDLKHRNKAVKLKICPTCKNPTPKAPKTIGEASKLTRISQGISLKELSQKSGISVTNLSMFENDKINYARWTPAPEFYDKVAKALGLKLADLEAMIQ